MKILMLLMALLVMCEWLNAADWRIYVDKLSYIVTSQAFESGTQARARLLGIELVEQVKTIQYSKLRYPPLAWLKFTDRPDDNRGQSRRQNYQTWRVRISDRFDLNVTFTVFNLEYSLKGCLNEAFFATSSNNVSYYIVPTCGHR